jgi:predicted peptidase
MKNPLFKKILQLVALIGLPLFSCAQKSPYEANIFTFNGDSLPYRIMYPIDFDATKQYPLILVLHGSGERGNNNEAQLVHGSGLFADEENRKNFPAIVIFPQCPADEYWATVERTYDEEGNRHFGFAEQPEPTLSMTLLIGLVEDFRDKSWVDQDRMYVGGLSMGGMGTFELLARQPDWFAAAFPICGGGDPESAAKYAEKTALWIFHGEDDDVVPVEHSIEMAGAIQKAGGNPKLTLYPKTGHDSWTQAFNEQDLLPWVFSHRKK